MLYATAFQGREFFAMALCGMLMAGVSLGFSLLRRLMAAGKGLCLICDGLMGVIWAALFCGFLMGVSGGRCRGYHLLATALGAALVSLLSSWFTGGGAPDIPLGFYTIQWTDWWKSTGRAECWTSFRCAAWGKSRWRSPS